MRFRIDAVVVSGFHTNIIQLLEALLYKDLMYNLLSSVRPSGRGLNPCSQGSISGARVWIESLYDVQVIAEQ